MLVSVDQLDTIGQHVVNAARDLTRPGAIDRCLLGRFGQTGQQGARNSGSIV